MPLLGIVFIYLLIMILVIITIVVTGAVASAPGRDCVAELRSQYIPQRGLQKFRITMSGRKTTEIRVVEQRGDL
jgi:hypothetical protein